MTSITKVMITRLPVAQRLFHTRFAKTIRIPRHNRIRTESNSHSEDNNSLYSQFSDDPSEDVGIEPEDRQSKSIKHKLPMAVAGFSSVRYNVTDANN